MLIRYKLLLLLLGIALIPLMAVSWWGYQSTRELGGKLAEESVQYLTERTVKPPCYGPVVARVSGTGGP